MANQFSKLALTPDLQDTTIFSMLNEMNKLQSTLQEDFERFPECLRRLNKTTNQYVTELSYAAEAVKDEANAKIKAQEELINPQIIQLNSEYKRQIANVSRGFEEEIEKLEKLNAKKLKFMDSEEKKLAQYELEAKNQALQNHLIYEKRWKAKSQEAKKELSGLKKEHKRIENNIKNLINEKNQKISSLHFELDSEVKLVRQPLIDLEFSRNSKMLIFRQETEKLLKLEKPLIDGLNHAIKSAEGATEGFQMIGIRNLKLKGPALFYIPFYVACFETGSTSRYLFLAPSTISSIGFSVKLKSVVGISKIKDIFIPRFKTIAVLIEKALDLTKQDSLLNHQIMDLGERNNLLKNQLSRVNIANGLVYLKDAGWLSQKEYKTLTNSLSEY